MNPVRAGDVLVVVAPRGATDAADRLFLAIAASWVLGLDPRSVRIARFCPHCGGQDHGRPLVAVSPGGRSGSSTARLAAAGSPPACGPLHVSLSRAGGSVALALTLIGPVGVDIESVDAASRGGFDEVAFGPAEHAALAETASEDAAGVRARLWTAKEAALKCTGDGLRVDPRDLTVSLPGGGCGGSPRLDAWRGARVPVDALRLHGFAPGPGLVGTVAVLAEGTPAAGTLSADGPTVRVVPAADIRRQPSRRA